MVLYEYPFNEGIRTMLRAEHLFDRLGQLLSRDGALDHHFALATLFEIIEVAGRSDLKSELMKELERFKSQYQALRGDPRVAGERLDALVDRLESSYQALHQHSGKAGQGLAGNEFLASIRSRIVIPGGTCEFDLPAYHAWQQHSPTRRRADLVGWVDTLTPVASALQMVMQMLREAGTPQRVVTRQGQFQQSLPATRSYQLLRLHLDPELDLVPEITCHRLRIGVRLLRAEPDGRLKPAGTDTAFDLALCG